MKELILIIALGYGLLWCLVDATCVLDADFGFVLNCGFKKSGLFRVRNLGGVKGYVGLGFSVGDEQRFNESLSNTEENRKRAVATARSSSLQLVPSKVPPFKPISPAQQNVSRPSRVAVIPPFQALPHSITKVADTARVPSAFRDSLNAATHHFQVRKDVLEDSNLGSNSIKVEPVKSPSPSLVAATLQSIAQATNLSVETVAAALTKTTTPRPATTTTDSKPSSSTSNPLASISKVMNAPKEYYPVNYDKDFDDNFASRVELPDTSFYCGDQKHFPGLYADEDLGCMVFHVCALTDDGLIMKSFLCPESTLFDQTILKCNWWFYVDCKNSKKLYDSNIPISKSYQLMKALAFFSTYNNKN